jgi:flagellin
MNELAVQGANDTNQDIDRDAINQELDALTTELDRISETTQFNKQNLLDGTFTQKNLQVGANTNQKITLSINNMNAAAIGLSTTSLAGKSGYLTLAGLATSKYGTSASVKVCAVNKVSATWSPAATTGAKASTGVYLSGMQTSAANAAAAKRCLASAYAKTLNITNVSAVNSKHFSGARVDDYDIANATISKVQNAINEVSSQRSYLGALQNRLEHTIANLDNVSENTQAAESRIRDTDMASEMVEYSKNNILAQAGQAMLAQANQSTQGVLSLLQ